MEDQLNATPRSNLVQLKNILIKTYTLMNILGKLVMIPNTNQQEQSKIKIGKSCISNSSDSKRGLGSWNETC